MKSSQGKISRCMLIAHNHKSNDADPLNRVIDSAELTGAVDGIFVIEKNRRIGSAARLSIANCDDGNHQFKLRFDRQNCRWRLIAETDDEDNDGENDLLFVMLDCLLDKVTIWSGTTKQFFTMYVVTHIRYNFNA